ncbi:2-amino-4-hydroxy-6-hydroxymethyldihydropteridine diphosphokinase [Mucilaginibacter terrae]|uniref:2-amino-4-hydroxy-6- hydroxymethyldihydropteridine diphosphokinase n=1 Tax=Mucilaginibacter terrae TaxID=1955052 RepID=UPI003637821E
MINVYLLLGSNLGNRHLFLKQAAAYIEAQAGSIVQYSGIYETKSWGKTDAPDYLNQVLLINTVLKPLALLNKLLEIELLLGRKRDEKWGSRTVDIDILFYDNQIINEPELTVPHPQLHNRRFTLVPLVEIAPEWIHPVLQKALIKLYNELKDDLQVKKYIFE